MKQSIIFLYAMIFALSISLIAQTNFVKHSGNPILPLGAAGEWDDTEAAYAHVLYDGSTYRMWYSGAPSPNTYRIGYATSADGISWDKFGMALGTGTSGSFDGIDVWLPWVLFDGTQYEMWYAGNTSSGGIGYITTADPASWTRQRTTPVLTGGGFNAWDNYAFGPVVLHTDTLYQMWYGGRLQNSGVWQTGYATSPDGINWTKHPNNPVLTVGASSEWDAVAAIVGSVVFDDGLYHMYYHGTNGDPFSGGEIGYATSPDGVTWTKHPDNPIMTGGAPGTWDDDNTWFPRVLKDGERYRMWYTGRGSATNGFDRLGYAEDIITGIETSDGTPPQHFDLKQNYPNPFNPSTTIEFILSQRASVTLKVFDLLGKEVATLVDKKVLAAGNHHKVFDASHLASGIYLYQMQAGQAFKQTRKLVLLK